MLDGIEPGVQPFYIGPEAWPAFAERLAPHLQKVAANSGGRMEASDIAAGIASSMMQAWVVLDGAEIACAMFTTIEQYPRLRALRIFGLVGHRPFRWMHLLRAVEDAARLNFGATYIECLHQERHAILLARSPGWAPYHMLSEKRLVP